MIRSTVAGIAIALAASLASAQVPKKAPPKKDTTAAPQHIKIVKETPKTKGKAKTAGGEIALPKIEETKPCEVALPVIDVQRDDSIRNDQYRLDSVAMAFERRRADAELQRQLAEQRERMRLDSIANAEAQARALARMLARGGYVAIAGGASTPMRSTRNGYTGGWNLTVPVGYDATDNPLGVRVDLSIDHMNGTRIHDQFENTTAMSGDITVWSLNTDAKLRFHPPGLSTRSHLYVLGGVGAHRVTGGVYGTNSTQAGQNLEFGSAGTKLGWNVGAGATVQWSGVELFVESRFFQVKSDLAYRSNGGIGTYTSFTPVIFGLNWF